MSTASLSEVQDTLVNKKIANAPVSKIQNLLTDSKIKNALISYKVDVNKIIRNAPLSDLANAEVDEKIAEAIQAALPSICRTSIFYTRTEYRYIFSTTIFYI